MFADLYSRTSSTSSSHWGQLGFLDLGANVGDWISPLCPVAPNPPIYAAEGAPATAAVSMANLRTSVELRSLQLASIEEEGGVCFDTQGRGENVGGQGVKSVGDSDCPATFIAGGTTFGSALKGLISPCPGLDWPRIYVAS
jgi:hypothetical protein